MKPPKPPNRAETPKATSPATAPAPAAVAARPSLTAEEHATLNGQKIVDSMNRRFREDPNWEVPF